MQSAGYDVWLFDLDGTLVDTDWEYKREVFDAVGAELGVTFDDRSVRRLWYGLGGDRGEIIREWGIDPDRFWAVFDRIDDPDRRAGATHLYEDAAVVADIDAPTAVVTHCPEPVTERVVDALDMQDWFDAVVCCSTETGFKPDPGPVECALAAVGCSDARGVLVGDGVCDVGAAHNAGIDSAHVERHGPAHRGYCVLADHRLVSLSEWGPLSAQARA